MLDKKKYPRTPHLPFSRSVQSDDVRLKDSSFLLGQEVVITEKMDGENTTAYSFGVHARSLDSAYHPSRSVVRAWHGSVAYLMPENYRFVMENLYAEHSIRYDSLDSFLNLFAVVQDNDTYLSWDDVEAWAAELGIPTAPVLFRGVLEESVFAQVIASLDTEHQEGFVVRSAEAFAEDKFAEHVAKWVRPRHVQTTEHWLKTWKPNALRS